MSPVTIIIPYQLLLYTSQFLCPIGINHTTYKASDEYHLFLGGVDKEKPWPRNGDYVATRLFTLKKDLNHYREDLHLKMYQYPSAHTSHKLHHFSDMDSVPAPIGLEVGQKEVHKRSKPKYFM